MPERRLPELLAPAGDFDAMRAAAICGADAVYFGVSRFNARQRAANFPLESLPERLAWLHEHNVRGYVTLNTLLFDSELKGLPSLVEQLVKSRVDAVIVQDPGVARVVHMVAPHLELHGSTQMSVGHSDAVPALKRLGLTRIILARELSLQQITDFTALSDLETEVFIHGAHCISASGQCHASRYFKKRSANRGLCAQLCRLSYKSDNGLYPLSPHDLDGSDYVAALTEAGVSSLKIEGRMKGANYVAAVVSFYRKLLDTGERDEELIELSRSLFSRGSSVGALGSVSPELFISGERPGNRGVPAGVVTRVSSSGVEVTLDGVPLQAGDGVVFVPPGASRAEEVGGNIYGVKHTRGERVLLSFAKGFSLSGITVGQGVWRTSSHGVDKSAASLWSRDRVYSPISVTGLLELTLGGPPTYTMISETGQRAEASLEDPLTEVAVTALSREHATRALGALGGTPFRLEELSISVTGSAQPHISPGSLKELRRRAAALLREALVFPPEVPLHSYVESVLENNTSPLTLVVVVSSFVQAVAVLDSWAATPKLPGVIFFPASVWDKTEGYLLEAPTCLSFGLVGPDFPLQGDADPGATVQPAALLLKNMASIPSARTTGMRLFGDHSLNVVNGESLRWAANEGIRSLLPGLDCRGKRLTDFVAAYPGWLEFPLHMTEPLMTIRHPYRAPANATLKAGEVIMKGAPGEQGGVVLHAPHPTEMLASLDSLVKLGIRRFRVGFHQESEATVRRLLGALLPAMAGQMEASL